MKRLILSVLAALALGACAHAASDKPSPQADARGALTILISIDGFRADYLDRGVAPAIAHLADEGVRASMRPSFPSVTFPNHAALITGLRPDRNGIVNNRMEDPERPGTVFAISDKAVANDPFWWAEFMPVWVSAERAGVRTATMFWPGSDLELHGVRPAHWRTFDQTLTGFARVDELLRWIDAGAGAEPLGFATLYFDIVDTAGHRYGPNSPDTNAAAAEVDAAIARLLDGLAARGLADAVNLIVVADHGMADVSDERLIDLDAKLGAARARVVWDGPNAGVVPEAGQTAAVEAALLGRDAHGQCWRKAELPARFHYGRHRRVPPIVCLADLGWMYRSAQMPRYGGPTLGAHGFDPDEPDMAALFVAHGPAFAEGARLEAFDNVSVYPLVMRLIGVEAAPNDGDISVFAPAFAPAPGAEPNRAP